MVVSLTVGVMLGFNISFHFSKEVRIWLLPFAIAQGFISAEGNSETLGVLNQ
jgi:hypothetical protein